MRARTGPVDRLFLFRHFDDREEQPERPDRIAELVVFYRFGDIDVASELVAPGNLVGIIGGREHDDGDLPGPLVVLDAFKHLVAVEYGKVEIEEDERGSACGASL